MAVRGLTYDDLAHFPDDGLRRELLDGEVYVLPSPTVWHQELLLRLAVLFSKYLERHGGGRVFVAPLDVYFTKRNVLEPDIIFVADADLDVVREKNLRGAPSLVIEVGSDSRHDRIRKRRLYERFKVPEYWIVDPDADRIEVYRRGERGYGKPEIYEPGDRLSPLSLPGLKISLTSLFRR